MGRCLADLGVFALAVVAVCAPPGLGFGVWSLGLRGLGFRVWGLGFRVWGSGFGISGLGSGVWGLGFSISWTSRV